MLSICEFQEVEHHFDVKCEKTNEPLFAVNPLDGLDSELDKDSLEELQESNQFLHPGKSDPHQWLAYIEQLKSESSIGNNNLFDNVVTRIFGYIRMQCITYIVTRRDRSQG